MVKDLAKYAKEKGVKYFMVSYTDRSVDSAPNWCQHKPSTIWRWMARVSQALPLGSI